eukprot:Gb_12698 [translate_table: standard]
MPSVKRLKMFKEILCEWAPGRSEIAQFLQHFLILYFRRLPAVCRKLLQSDLNNELIIAGTFQTFLKHGTEIQGLNTVFEKLFNQIK